MLGFAELMTQGASSKLTGTNYVQMMSHTAAVNIGLFFGMTGRIIPTSSACTSGSQGIGYAYEAIRFGLQDVMVAGGAEELCATEAAVFDTLYATSIRNDAPSTTPRPFDRDRDGWVIGEGAATLVMEEMQHARARNAPIHAEVVGFGTNSDGNHITQPSAETMQIALRLALQDAELPPEAIGFVSAHGTATEWGDIAESQATAAVLGHHAPIHSLKSYFGHSLKPGKPLSNMALLALLKRMGRPDLTVHGFRSAFRDWAAERTNFPHEVCEMALAHAIGDKMERAYRRSDLFVKRRQLMEAWAR